jgi:queuine tRNA-ribosyltransferase
MTDSGGFQAFSLGAAFGKNISKIAKDDTDFIQKKKNENKTGFAKITEDGVAFRNYKSGEKLFFSPEKSMQIRQDLGADIAFAFDECTSPQATYEYQKEAMNRTHRWAIRSLEEHQKLEKEKFSFLGKVKNKISETIKNTKTLLQEAGPERNTRDQTTGPASYPQALFGIVQGGRYQDLREESAEFIGNLGFDGFGIGGSFDKDDMDKAVKVVNEKLPENKPRHLLGIGEPIDFFMGIENGVDFFDCVAPTRMARHGTLHTREGRLNIKNASYKADMGPVDKTCGCYTCQNYSRAYVHHLLREEEMLGMTLASIHNLYFVVNLVKEIRQSVLDENFFEFKEKFLKNYYKK